MTSRKSQDGRGIKIATALGLPVVLLALDLMLSWTQLTLDVQILWTILLALLGTVVTLQLEVISQNQKAADELQESHTKQLEAIRAEVYPQHEVLGILNSYSSVLINASANGQAKDIELIFAQRLLDDTKHAMETLATSHRYEMEVRSPARQYSSRWIDVLDSLMGTNGQFKTITNAVVWSGEYLGFRAGISEYLASQIRAARTNGFVVKRLFVVPSPVAAAEHPEMAKEIRSILEKYHKATAASAEFMQCRVLELESREYKMHFFHAPHDVEEIIGKGWSGNFGVWEHGQSKTVNLVKYDEEPSAMMGRAIEAISFLCNAQVAARCSSYFEDRWDSTVSKSLEEYLEIQPPSESRNLKKDELSPAPRGPSKSTGAPRSEEAGQQSQLPEAQS